MENTLKIWFYSFVHLFFPRCCVVCDTLLVEGEEELCTRCNIDMPRTGYHLLENNPVERMFFGKIPLVRATSYFFYRKGSNFRKILHAKYKTMLSAPLQKNASDKKISKTGRVGTPICSKGSQMNVQSSTQSFILC